ncbi:MAG: DUF523 and DUF1722 domain-containing protein [Deltaproteobacteria bacterium]|nr:DUF523 and DUF1722 domain-containing protein [Candidatus Zymogenaceae bacterium]
MQQIRIGISTCLLGENVRYNGGHSLDRFLRDTLGKYVKYVPVCPEVECGFGIPREALRLTGDPKKPRLVTSNTGVDHTDRMETWARNRVRELEKENLCGFIFKSDSPSSGMERVKVYDHDGVPRKSGVGVFARIFMEHFPLTPAEEDGRLYDPILREDFIDRIYTYRRYSEIVEDKKLIGSLVDFHARNKLLLMAHSPKHLKQMGYLVAHSAELSKSELIGQYEKLLMGAMALKPSTAKHTNVLHHVMGYFKKNLATDEKQELVEVIDEYRRGFIPLIVPVTLLNHYVRKYDQPYLKEQTYLNPRPLGAAALQPPCPRR